RRLGQLVGLGLALGLEEGEHAVEVALEQRLARLAIAAAPAHEQREIVRRVHVRPAYQRRETSSTDTTCARVFRKVMAQWRCDAEDRHAARARAIARDVARAGRLHV